MHRVGPIVGWKRFFFTSVGKKQIVALTGLGMSGFIVTHVAANMMLLFSPQAYNEYSHKLVTNPLLPIAEWGLVLMLVVHVWYAVNLVLANRAARTVGYYQRPNSDGKGSSFAVRTAILSGLLLFAFLVLHLITFKYGTYYTTQYNGVEMRDLYRLVAEKFHEPGYVVWYVFSMVVLGLHLRHGISSVFQSLGATGVRQPLVQRIGLVFAVLVAGGFISQPLYFILGGGK